MVARLRLVALVLTEQYAVDSALWVLQQLLQQLEASFDPVSPKSFIEFTNISNSCFLGTSSNSLASRLCCGFLETFVLNPGVYDGHVNVPTDLLLDLATGREQLRVRGRQPTAVELTILPAEELAEQRMYFTCALLRCQKENRMRELLASPLTQLFYMQRFEDEFYKAGQNQPVKFKKLVPLGWPSRALPSVEAAAAVAPKDQGGDNSNNNNNNNHNNHSNNNNNDDDDAEPATITEEVLKTLCVVKSNIRVFCESLAYAVYSVKAFASSPPDEVQLAFLEMPTSTCSAVQTMVRLYGLDGVGCLIRLPKPSAFPHLPAINLGSGISVLDPSSWNSNQNVQKVKTGLMRLRDTGSKLILEEALAQVPTVRLISVIFLL